MLSEKQRAYRTYVGCT